MFHERRDLWDRFLRGPENGRISIRSDLSHLLKSSKDDTFFGLHGDAGAFSHQDSMFVISFNCLASKGRTSETRFPIAMVRKSQLLDGGETLDLF